MEVINMGRVEFVSYDGEYPNLCSGLLIVKIDGKEVKFGRTACTTVTPEYDKFWCSGGGVHSDEDWNMWTTKGEWGLNDVEPEFEDVAEELIKVFNENVPYGCCGGCI